MTGEECSELAEELMAKSDDEGAKVYALIAVAKELSGLRQDLWARHNDGQQR